MNSLGTSVEWPYGAITVLFQVMQHNQKSISYQPDW